MMRERDAFCLFCFGRLFADPSGTRVIESIGSHTTLAGQPFKEKLYAKQTKYANKTR